MLQASLNDAAIALHNVFNREHINFGIFGGYAISALGGVRESKDIDCLASVSKEKVTQILTETDGFRVIPQSREDYVAFLWSDHVDGRNPVLIEIFCERFPGATYVMDDVASNSSIIIGRNLGEGTSMFLEPFLLFKGKLRAAATRAKFHDSADLRMLGGKFENIIKSRANKVSLEYVVQSYDLEDIPPPAVGDVQRGLLA
ncbi:hypothetical protein CFAM422_009597 [Trichoderma lentiforme]|uniref:Nucleotidyltransferase n=1 Tax=Trichoderma lentiforme TaxID=1567552 RepID=A0A9P4X977_9HYPO|nr:hypothetical protein CFAM422_009597 [Trichoderma lentiforme]